jgi:hypothetical protein
MTNPLRNMHRTLITMLLVNSSSRRGLPFETDSYLSLCPILQNDDRGVVPLVVRSRVDETCYESVSSDHNFNMGGDQVEHIL